MKLIDMHCDTLSLLLRTEGNLKETSECVTIPRLQSAGAKAQFFACFTYFDEKKNYDASYLDVLRMIDIMERECSANSDEIAIALTYDDMVGNCRDGRLSAFLTVEEGGVINGRMERLEELYDRGVRLLTPIWNYENCFGAPNSRDADLMNKGLTAFGKEALSYASDKGVILDVSHASDGSFRDMLDCAKGPIVASHSNCRELCAHPRNLSDEMIHVLAERGGVGGLNFYGHFLDGTAESRLEAMLAHLKHMINKGGAEFPAIGSDFDGFDGMTREDIPSVDSMDKLWFALVKAGFGEDLCERIFYRNAERIIREILI